MRVSKSLTNILLMCDTNASSVIIPSLLTSKILSRRSLRMPGKLQYWTKVTLSSRFSLKFYCPYDTKLLRARSL